MRHIKLLTALTVVLFLGTALYAGFAFIQVSETRATQEAPTYPSKPQVKQVDTVAAAAAEAGFTVKQPLAPGWTLKNASVIKYATQNGKTLVEVDMTFGAGDPFIFLSVYQPPIPREAQGDSNPSPIEVRGTNGTLFRGPAGNPDHLAVTWDEGGLTYFASTFQSKLPQDEFLKVVESIQ
jgi:hypothetical protein